MLRFLFTLFFLGFLALVSASNTVPRDNLLYMDLVGQQCYMNLYQTKLHWLQKTVNGLIMNHIPRYMVEEGRRNILTPPIIGFEDYTLQQDLLSNPEILSWYLNETIDAQFQWEFGVPGEQSHNSPLTGPNGEVQNYDTGVTTAVFHKNQNEEDSLDGSLCCCAPSYFVLCNTQDFSVPFALHSIFPWIQDFNVSSLGDLFARTAKQGKRSLDELEDVEDWFDFLEEITRSTDKRSSTFFGCPLFAVDFLTNVQYQSGPGTTLTEIEQEGNFIPPWWQTEHQTFCSCGEEWNQAVDFMFSSNNEVTGVAPWEENGDNLSTFLGNGGAGGNSNPGQNSGLGGSLFYQQGIVGGLSADPDNNQLVTTTAQAVDCGAKICP